MTRKTRLALLLLVSAATLATSLLARSDGETYVLTQKYTNGEKWYVVSEFHGTVALSVTESSGDVGELTTTVKRVDSVERIHDNVDDSGVLVGMTVNVLKSAVLESVGAAAPVETNTAIHGRTIIVAFDKPQPVTFADGDGGPVGPENFTAEDTFLLLVPKKPVAKGDTWSISGPNLARIILRDIPGAAAKIEAACTLVDIETRDSFQVAVIKVALAASSDAQQNEVWDFKLTSGRFEFNITTGRPIRLELEGIGNVQWNRLGSGGEVQARYKATVAPIGLKINYGTSDFVMPPEDSGK
ncbi:MAG: hypothetical protein RDV41_05190 [Planctomycetota bacterium]|nr:hypothetical protein [Planctomycetota bacterium]